ncbi:MAG: hypothetical protein IJW57_10005 [Spirochaetaceae bacterium]|nr:hypothetical protein [Spirochaetaceae bacterium]
MDEKRFYEILDEDYQNEAFKPLVDNRESVKAIRAKFAEVKFPTHDVEMSDKQIDDIFENMKYD